MDLKIIVPKTLEILTLVGSIIIALIILGFIINKITKKNNFEKINNFFRKNYLISGIIITLIATLGSLFYSEIIGYNPCKLCGYQRILMYPQILIFGAAIYIKDKKIFRYSIILSIIGGLVAVYHYLLQIGFLSNNFASCNSVGYSISCSQNFGMHYGYITIPMMAIIAFILLIILGLNIKYEDKNVI